MLASIADWVGQQFVGAVLYGAATWAVGPSCPRCPEIDLGPLVQALAAEERRTSKPVELDWPTGLGLGLLLILVGFLGGVCCGGLLCWGFTGRVQRRKGALELPSPIAGPVTPSSWRQRALEA